MIKLNFISRLAQCAALALLMTACTTTKTTPLNYYDLGALPKSANNISDCNLPPVNLADMSSPGALDSNLMLYRLLYDNDQQNHAYATNRWSMPPAQLLTLRIKSQLADNGVRLLDNGVANPNGWQLRLDLVDFSQYFSDAAHSYVQLQLRVSLLRANALIAQTTFKQQANADSPNAQAGARAMRTASDTLITDLSGWLCKQPKS